MPSAWVSGRHTGTFGWLHPHGDWHCAEPQRRREHGSRRRAQATVVRMPVTPTQAPSAGGPTSSRADSTACAAADGIPAGGRAQRGR